MVSQKTRQTKILELIRTNRVESQGMLAELLEKEGCGVAQATLSRDIRELGLVKVRSRYQVSGEAPPPPQNETVRRAFAQFVTGTDAAGNIVMIRTSSGNAHSICVIVDTVGWPEVLGTIAGDDTIFILVRDQNYGKKLLGKIRELIA